MEAEKAEKFMSAEEVESAIKSMIEELFSYPPDFWDRHPELQSGFPNFVAEGEDKEDKTPAERAVAKSHLEQFLNMVRNADDAEK
ncbi:MAG: hypothetical protein AAB655_01935 [Patescibacteria group bacterium]